MWNLCGGFAMQKPAEPIIFDYAQYLSAPCGFASETLQKSIVQIGGFIELVRL